MTKQYKALTKKQLAKMSTREQQDYQELQKKERKQNTELVAQALKQGLREKVKNL